MKMNKFSYIFNSGKNPKWIYFLRSYLIYFLPKSIAQWRLKSILAKAKKRSDWDYICERVDYYNKLSGHVALPANAMTIGEHTLKNKKSSSVYFFDSYEFLRYFPTHYKWLSEFGDVTWVPKYPSLVKSRPIDGDNANSVVLKLDKVRHFIFVDDRRSFAEKEDKAIIEVGAGVKLGMLASILQKKEIAGFEFASRNSWNYRRSNSYECRSLWKRNERNSNRSYMY